MIHLPFIIIFLKISGFYSDYYVIKTIFVIFAIKSSKYISLKTQ